MDSKSDLSFVSSFADNEYKSVVIFNGLDSRFGGEWVLDNSELVEGVGGSDSSVDDSSRSSLDSGVWSSEGDSGPDLGLSSGMGTLLNSSSSSVCLLQKINILVKRFKNVYLLEF